MSRLKKLLSPNSYWHYAKGNWGKLRLRYRPNEVGVRFYSPGHFYSPLLDVQNLADSVMPFDGPDYWEHVDLRVDEQRAFYTELLERFPFFPFPQQSSNGFRYFTDNGWFVVADAFTLSGIIRKEKPRRIVEVGSGFSSAVMLDTISRIGQPAALTFIEPFPERLHSLLSAQDRSAAKILVRPVQQIPMDVFDQLEEHDILFIDSSHVAKVGSDVTHIFLRLLPRLKRGVLVHFHDIFYPFSYPEKWIREGRAWNESLFLRAFLIQNPAFQIVAFNSFAGSVFPDVFRERMPAFLANTGGSIWLRKVA